MDTRSKWTHSSVMGWKSSLRMQASPINLYGLCSIFRRVYLTFAWFWELRMQICGRIFQYWRLIQEKTNQHFQKCYTRAWYGIFRIIQLSNINHDQIIIHRRKRWSKSACQIGIGKIKFNKNLIFFIVIWKIPKNPPIKFSKKKSSIKCKNRKKI